MGGLFSGLALRQRGYDVDVFERTAGELESRGAGIVAQPRMLRWMEDNDIATREGITTTTERRVYLNRDDTTRREYESSMTFTSWDGVYRRLRGAFPADRYHMGRTVVDLEQGGGSVTARFENGDEESSDLLVVAEGGRSHTRKRLVPDIGPAYAGYVAWRGLLPEDDVPGLIERFEDAFVFYEGANTLILGYLIPGPDGEVAAGDRRLNWVWYDTAERDGLDELLVGEDGTRYEFSVPPGELREEVRKRRDIVARDGLPDTFSRLVEATDEPFVQTIYDLSVPEMGFGRACLLGDAAFVARPHTAAGTAKAAADAIELAESLDGHDGLGEALNSWEANRLEAGEELVAEGKRMGDGYMK